ncbi:MAG: hypothetical protein HOI95_11300 [Chromatiales bacterium]|jgi:amidase|nr:hypothetical protein [Chromatiales bacterium]
MTKPHVSANHGRVATFSRQHPPTLTVDAGETFTLETADRFVAVYEGSKPDPNVVGGLVGPVFIRGANPGDTLEIRVEHIAPVTGYAYILASPGYGILGDRVASRTKRVAVDENEVQWDEDTTFATRPMIGKLGIAPGGNDESSRASGTFGGAISSTQVGPGASLYLPVAVAGALLSLEDVHAQMGDGESTSSAVEMAARVRLTCHVHPKNGWPLPIVVTADEVITHGQGETLDLAAGQASRAMLDLIKERLGVDETEAAMLVGAVVDLRISFIGGTPRKVRAAIPKNLVNF